MSETTNRKLTQFFVITFIFSWLLWLPSVLKSNGFPDLPDIVGLPGMFAPFGPAVAAFWLTWKQDGKAGMKQLWMRGWQLNFDKKWLVPTLLLGPVATLVAAGLILLLGGTLEWQYALPALMIVPIFLLIYFTQALPEEYGWRGYAIDRLQTRFNALTASLVLGAIWAAWHLPLFFIEGTTQASIPFYEYLLQTMVLAIFYTWLVNNTGGSVLIAALFHAIGNTASAAIPYWTTTTGRWLDFGVLVAFALLVTWQWGGQHLSKQAVDPKPTV